MNKEEFLKELSAKITTGEISREEIAIRLSLTSPTQTRVIQENSNTSTPFSITKMLYVLGAAIVLIGIFIFVFRIWNDIESFERISATLGLGFLITAIGSMLSKSKPDENIGAVFHFIGGILIPGGVIVTLSELNVDSFSLWPVANGFGAIFLFYLLLNSVHKHPILTIYAIVNGTAFFYLLVEAIVDGPFEAHLDLYADLTMVIGVSYLLLGHAFRDGWNKKLVAVLYCFGITGFLGSAFSQVFDSVFWQILYFNLVIGCLALSVYIRSRSILVLSTLFLIGHVSYITGKYFADSLGWPISLVIIGFAVIGLGYVSININKKYISN